MSIQGIIDLVLPLFFFFCFVMFIIRIIYQIITGQKLSKSGDSDGYNHNHFNSDRYNHNHFNTVTINPASGLPMSGGVDAAGNAFGQNHTSGFHDF